MVREINLGIEHYKPSVSDILIFKGDGMEFRLKLEESDKYPYDFMSSGHYFGRLELEEIINSPLGECDLFPSLDKLVRCTGVWRAIDEG